MLYKYIRAYLVLAALTKIQNKCLEPEGLAARALVYQKAKELTSSGHSITLRWVPGHSKVEGNEKADLAAKRAAVIRNRLLEFTYSCENRTEKISTG